MAESPHILSIEVDVALTQAERQVEQFRENAEKPINIPVAASGGAGTGNRPPTRTAAGAPFPSDESPIRGTPSQERQAQEQGFSSYAEKMAAVRQIQQQSIQAARPLPQPGVDTGTQTPADISQGGPPAFVSRKSIGTVTPAELAQEMRGTYMAQLQRGDRPAAVRTLGTMQTMGFDISGMPTPSQYADEQKTLRQRDKLEERYQTRYENRLASDAAGQEREQHRTAQRVDKNFDAYELAKQKAAEREAKAAEKAAAAEEKRAQKVQARADRENERRDERYQNRLASDAVKSERQATRLDKAQFQAQLKGMSPSERIQALNQRLSDEDLEPMERAQLAGQRNAAQVAEGRAGHLRMRIFGAAFTAYEGVSALATAATENFRMDRVLQQQGADAWVDQQLQATEARQQGIGYFVRQTVARSGYLGERVLGAVGLRGAFDRAQQFAHKHFGLPIAKPEDFDDDAYQKQLTDIRNQKIVELAKVDIAAEGLRGARAREQEENQAYNISVHDPYRRAKFEAADEYNAKVQADKDRLDVLRQQYFNETDPTKKDILFAQFQSVLYNQPLNEQTARKTLSAKSAEINYQQGLAADQQGYANQAAKSAMSGNDYAAALQRIDTKYNPHYDKTGQLVSLGDIDRADSRFGKTEEARQLEMKQAGIDESRRQDQLAGSMNSMADALARKPLQSRIDELNAQRSMALEGPGGRTINMNSDKAREVMGFYDQQIAVAKMEDSDQRRLTIMGLNTERAQLGILARNPQDTTGAEIAGILGSGLQRASSLYNKEHPEIAREALENTRQQLGVAKQQFLNDFRGVQYDPRLMAISARDQSDVGGTIKEFGEAMKKATEVLGDLSQIVTDAVTNAVSAATTG